jgi:hypothetical protein
MNELEIFEDEAGGTVFRDVIMLALVGFVAMVILLLPFIQPPGTDAQADVVPPGNVVVEARWPDEIDADVDLWVQAPGDVPVGYSNKGGAAFNLLRDDLGHRADATEVNYETAYSRGILPGEYTVNLHLFRNESGVSPIRVVVVTSVKAEPDEPTEQLLKSEVLLVREDEEVTAYRFRLTEAGELVAGSVHGLYKELRSRRSS